MVAPLAIPNDANLIAPLVGRAKPNDDVLMVWEHSLYKELPLQRSPL